MLDLSVIILTYNEEIHIRRCIENVKSVAKEIFIVDSFSTDKTIEIAKNLNAQIYQNKWENNHAKQFNWALDNLPIKTKWVLRLDADEYLTDELLDELKQKLPSLSDSITGIVFKRRRIFLDKWVKSGGEDTIRLLRLFQYKKAICEKRFMDEYIQLLEGKCIDFVHDFVDHNLNDISWWTNKHIGYAIREAVDLLNIEYNFWSFENNIQNSTIGRRQTDKRKKKLFYARKPLFIRSFLYFLYRYFFKFGFIDGIEGFLWHFLQGWWYRTLVDVKILEIKRECKNDKDKIMSYLKEKYSIDLSRW
jgi:glycosyltransferase involved in cell wall biosynthesis